MRHLKQVAAALVLGALASGSAQAQLSNTLYFHHNDYRQHFVNPSRMPDTKFYFGIPAVGTIAFAGGNNGVSFSDVIKTVNDHGKKRTVLFLDEAYNGQKEFLDILHANEHVSAEVRVNLLDFGFKFADKNFLSFTVSGRGEANAFVPKEFFSLVLEGMERNSVYDLNAGKISMNMNAWAEFAVGYTRQANEKLSVGGAVKYLHSIIGAKTKFKDLSLKGSADEWKLVGDCDVYMAVPGIVVENEDGHFKEVNFFEKDDNNDINYMKASGKGLALDLGATYNVNDRLHLSASLIDLGFIRTSGNTARLSLQREFVYNGGEYDPESQNIKFQDFSDDLENAFLGQTGGKYSQWLTAKAYVGAEYDLFKKFSVGVLSKTSFNNNHVWEDFTVTGNFHPIKYFSYTLAWNIYDHQWSGLGSGITLNLGPLNVFAAIDNIPLRFAKTGDALIPLHMKHVRVNVGLGIVAFERKKKDKKDEDDAPVVDQSWMDEEPEPDFYDADGDGVEDAKDRCPGTPAGVAVDFMGCPFDADKDGVPDYMDECSDTPEGVAVDEKGCPVDTDKDGVPDYQDACENTPEGVKVTENGCPVDSDSDGVPDYLDNCPDKAGPASNNGCPLPEVKKEVQQLFKKALNGIQFQTGKATILKSSFPILDQIANTMKTNPDWKLNISGHTDNVGNAAKNLQLSKDRAESVKQYLVNKGVQAERLASEGYGDTKPLVPNTTTANRAKNRRVEFEVEYMQTVPVEN